MLEKNKRLNNFDFIRLAAASLVILGHGYTLNAAPGTPHFLNDSVSTFAVKVFLAISGYLVVKSWHNDPNLYNFFKKRLLRIWPALVFIILLTALLLGPLVTELTLNEYFRTKLFFSYFKNIFLYCIYPLPGVFQNNVYPSAVNGSLWTLPVEVSMYTVPPLIALLCRSRENLFKLSFLILSALVVLLNTYVFSLPAGTVQRIVIYQVDMLAWLEIVPYFFVGGSLYLLKDTIRFDTGWAFFLTFALIANSNYFPSFEMLQILIMPYIIMTFGLISSPVIRSTAKFGDLSYGVYLYGFPIQQTIIYYLKKDISLFTSISFTLALSYTFAFLSWHLVEKRFLRLKK